MKKYSAEELNALSKEELLTLLLQTQEQNAFFMEQIATMQAQRFGRKTERLECMGQDCLFNEAEVEAEAAEENIRKEYLVNQIAQRHAIMNWTLGNNIDKKRISVEFENGILKIILPFRPKEEIETIIDIK